MCKRISCPKCGKATWEGCGQHREQVLGSVDEHHRCPNWKSGISCAVQQGPSDSPPNVDSTSIPKQIQVETTTIDHDDDVFLKRLVQEAKMVLAREPELSGVLHHTILADCVESFEDAVACTLCYRLLLQPTQMTTSTSSCQQQSTVQFFPPESLPQLIQSAMKSPILELGHSIGDAIRADAEAVCQRDPAMDTLLEVILFSKGYASLTCHRISYRLWHMGRKFTAYWLQSQTSATFGLDIHPCTQIGKAVMFDHGTGVVIGETAIVGDGCTILHGVTLGGTGKDSGNRHPKVGTHVLIGAGVSILGNITIGSFSKIGAGSVVLRPIPHHATAVGVPAKIIGRVTESDPGDEVDNMLVEVNRYCSNKSSSTIGTEVTVPLSEAGSTSFLTSTTEVDVSDNASITTTGTDADELLLKNTDELCPFRGLNQLAENAPPATMTICTIFRLFKPMGASQCRLGASFYELDTRGVGHVHWSEDLVHEATNIIVDYTGLPASDVYETLQQEMELVMKRHGDAIQKHKCCGLGKLHHSSRRRTEPPRALVSRARDAVVGLRIA